MTDDSDNRRAALGVALVGLASAVALFLLMDSDGAEPAPVVPMGYAMAHGADRWEPTTRQAFLQDPTNQWPMTPSQTQARLQAGPENWRPPLAQCDFQGRFIALLERYELDVSAERLSRLKAERQRCYTQFQ